LRPLETATIPAIAVQTTKSVYADDPRIIANPIFGLCQRLATHRIVRGALYDPKGVLRGRHRLKAMIGYALPEPIFRRLCLLSSGDWEALECAWAAIMLTVTLNPRFDPTFRDWALEESIQDFKVWFIKSCLMKLEIKQGPPGFSRKTFVAKFRDRLTNVCLTWKTVSKWMQWASCDWDERNPKPKQCAWLPGYNHKLDLPVLPWFGGHLHACREIIGRRPRSKDDLATLAQMGTFGRALPPPGEAFLKKSLQKTISVLTTPVILPQEAMNATVAFCDRLGRKLCVKQMPTQTHVSVSRSGTLESSQHEGGKAADCREYLAAIAETRFRDAIIFDVLNQREVPLGLYLESVPVLYDVYGQVILSEIWNHFQKGEEYSPEPAPGSIANDSLLWRMYSNPSELPGRRKISTTISDIEWMPQNSGHLLLAVATAEADKCGSWSKRPLAKLRVGGKSTPAYDIPLWDISGLCVRYKPERFPAVLVMSLAEPSTKARPLGKGEAWVQILGQAMRFMAEPIVARDGRARLGLESDTKLWDFLKFIQKGRSVRPGFVIQNTDRESATDHLQFDYIRSLWQGFTKTLPDTHPFHIFMELLWSPRILFPDPKLWGSCESFISTGGSLMGEPVSFLTLTLASLNVDDMTVYYTALRDNVRLYELPLKPLIGGDPSAVAGDDLTSIRLDARAASLSRKISTDLGEVLSPDKDHDSRIMMIFCEDRAFVELDEKGQLVPTFIDTIKCRLFTKMTRMHSDHRVALLGKGQAISKTLEFWPTGPIKASAVRIFTDLFRREYPGVDENRFYPVHLPPMAGGLGLPRDYGGFPKWETLYVKYVVWLTNQPRSRETIREVLHLADLNTRVKYGLDVPRTPSEVLDELASFTTEEFSVSTFILKPKMIYSLDQTKTILEAILGRTVPLTAYGRFSYEVLVREARMLGLIPMWDAFDLIERSLVFNELLRREGEPPTLRTLSKWQRAAKKFWLPRLARVQPETVDISSIKSAKDLVWRLNNYWGGFVLTETINGILSRYGPTLQVNLRPSHGPVSPMLRGGNKELSINSIRERLGIEGDFSLAL
jgi:hypothetical protein